jgi:hypothetical protein
VNAIFTAQIVDVALGLILDNEAIGEELDRATPTRLGRVKPTVEELESDDDWWSMRARVTDEFLDAVKAANF